MGRSAEECKNETVSLLASYRREKNKEKKTKGTGKGTSEVDVSRWFAYEALHFLEDRDAPRKRINTDTMEEVVGYEGTEVEAGAAEERNQQDATPDETFAIPKPPKRAKGKERDHNSMMISSAFEILKMAAAKLDTPPTENDEVTSFFKFVNAKVKNYSPETRKGVQHAVFDVLKNADRGYYEWPAENVHYSCHQPYSADGRHSNFMSHKSAPLFPVTTSFNSIDSTPILQPQSQQTISTLMSSILAPTSCTLYQSVEILPTQSQPSPGQQSQESVSSYDFV